MRDFFLLIFVETHMNIVLVCSAEDFLTFLAVIFKPAQMFGFHMILQSSKPVASLGQSTVRALICSATQLSDF